MTVTMTIPVESPEGLGVGPGDVLRVLDVREADWLVEVRKAERGADEQAPASARMEAAMVAVRKLRGCIKLEPGETADDLRQAYLREKLESNGA